MPTKICIKCRVEKDIELFPKTPNCCDGHLNQCKECKKIYNKAHKNKPEDEKEEKGFLEATTNLIGRSDINILTAPELSTTKSKYDITGISEDFALCPRCNQVVCVEDIDVRNCQCYHCCTTHTGREQRCQKCGELKEEFYFSESQVGIESAKCRACYKRYNDRHKQKRLR